MGFGNDVNTTGCIAGNLAGCVAGSIAATNTGYAVANKLQSLALKHSGPCIWDKFMNTESYLPNAKGKAVAIAIGALVGIGCVLAGTSIGAKIGEYIDDKKSDKVNYHA